MARSSTLVIHVVKPCSCDLLGSINTLFAILSDDIWYNLFANVNADIMHDRLGGKCPVSPKTIALLVVAFTQRIHLAKCKKTLSTARYAALFVPHASLPYTRIGLTIASNMWSIIPGGNFSNFWGFFCTYQTKLCGLDHTVIYSFLQRHHP